MKILALDAATEACSVALLLDGVVQETFEVAPREHARLLLPMAQELLKQADLALTELDAIAVGRGPGAFTGIRIAMSMAQGLALGSHLPVVPVSTLAALALRNHRLHGASKSLVVQDARMQEVYWAAFDVHAPNFPTPVTAESVSPPANLPIEDYDADWSAVGSGWSAYAEPLSVLQARVGTGPEIVLPHAQEVALLAERLLDQGHKFSVDQAMPSYVRNDVAKKSAKSGLL